VEGRGMFKVKDKNSNNEYIVYSVRSGVVENELNFPVEIGSRVSGTCVEKVHVTEFLFFNEHYKEWVWVGSEEYEPI
jgi:hypothetical protein